MRNGVDRVATYSTYTLRISMPEGKECCKYCPCIHYDRDRDARVCKYTGELLTNYDITLGDLCILNKEDKEC